MQLAGEYDFLESTQQDGVDIWKAREKSSGKPVLIHLYPASKQNAANAICERLLLLPAETRRTVLKFGPVQDGTCFVTDLLPPGESLQSWIDRKGGSLSPDPGPAVRLGAIGNLRKLGIEPAAVAPLPPGPNSAAGGPPGGFTELYSVQQFQNPGPAPAMPAPPAEVRNSSDNWSKFYGGGESRSFAPPSPATAEPDPEPAPAPAKPPSLESFIFVKSDIPAPGKPVAAPRPALPEPPPMIVRRHDTPPPAPKPLPLFDLPAVPAPEPLPVLPPIQSMADSPAAEPRVKAIPGSLPSASYRPAAPPPMPHRPAVYTAIEKTRAEPIIDWRIVLLVIAILLAAGGALVAIVGTAVR